MKLYKETLNDNFTIFNGFQYSIENCMYYIRENDKVIGMIEIWNNVPSSKYRYINILIFKEYRHKGLCKKALSILESILYEQGINELLFKSDSSKNEELYNKLGFTKIENYILNGYVFQKEIINEMIIKKEA